MDIFRSTMNELQDAWQKPLNETTGARQRMKAVVHCHIMFHIQRQNEAIIADSELRGLTARNYKEIIQMRDDYESLIQDVLAEGVAEGIFPQSDIKVISYAILFMCTAVCFFRKTAQGPSSRRLPGCSASWCAFFFSITPQLTALGLGFAIPAAFRNLESYTLLALPLFIMAGGLMRDADISKFLSWECNRPPKPFPRCASTR